MKILLTIYLFAISFISTSQINFSEIDSLMNSTYPQNEPGASILISKKGNIIYKKAFGLSNLEHKIKNTPEHIFQIGSITKQFTAASILMLVEQGKISLNDPITKYIEDYPTHNQNITIHHLLTHTSGIKNYTTMPEWWKVWRQDFTPTEMIGVFKNQPLEFKPGEKFSYSNSGYFLLGYIIEKISGLTYSEFIEKNIFKPLGMYNSLYGSHTKLIQNRANGYQKDTEYVNAEYLSLTQPYAAGSIMSNVNDLFLWNQAIMSFKLLKKETIQKAFTNYKLTNGSSINYGYGWIIDEINGSPTIEHSGGIFGFSSNGIYLPNEDVYVIVLTNKDSDTPGEISTKIASIVIEKPYKTAKSTILLDSKYSKSLTGNYEFEDGITRVITFEEGQLYSQRIGGLKTKLIAINKTSFAFESNVFSYLKFIIDKRGKHQVIYSERIKTINGVKSENKKQTPKEVTIDQAILQKYIGNYELVPGFTIAITEENGKLMCQATGQEKLELYPENETKFFLKVVDAKINFFANEEGKFDKMTLYLNGREITGTRIK